MTLAGRAGDEHRPNAIGGEKGRLSRYGVRRNGAACSERGVDGGD
jgi:hypothetical protein